MRMRSLPCPSRPGNAIGLAHADDLVRRERARAHAALVAAAVHLRLDANTRLRRNVQGAVPLGVGLVRGQALRSTGSVVTRSRPAGGLCPIDVEDDPAFAQMVPMAGMS